jgi:anti-sigma factor RsiW
MSQPRLPYYRAPSGLHERVSTRLRRTPLTASPRSRWRASAWIAAAAALIVFATAGGAWWLGASGRATKSELTGALDAHLRSLVPGHLVDVASTDQHTVKPWFAGKVEFSPPVTDFAAQGFPLVGGRVDVVGGRSMAALVYSRRNHIINVFIRPAGDVGQRTDAASLQGINIMGWSNDAMHYWMLSDLNPRELSELRNLLNAASGR